MDDDMIDETEAGYIELTWRLEAYAEQRLSPSTAATTRMRTAVMNAAHRRAALMAADATFDAAGETTSTRAGERARSAGHTRTSWRRPVAALFAGALTLMILAGTAYGARPGGPLYGARLWTEMANLPAGLVARAEAEGARLDRRLQEAQQASTAGDVPGTEAALAAYSTIVVEATQASVGDQTASAALEVGVTRHVVVLTQLVDTVPIQARGAVTQALSSSQRAIDELDRSSGGHATDPTRSADPGNGNDPNGPGVPGIGQPQHTPPAIAPGQTNDGTNGPARGNGKGPTAPPTKSKPTEHPTAAPHRPTPSPPSSSSIDRPAGAAKDGQ